MTTTEAARLLGKHPMTLTNWRMWGRGPQYVRQGRRILYRMADLKRWMKNGG